MIESLEIQERIFLMVSQSQKSRLNVVQYFLLSDPYFKPQTSNKPLEIDRENGTFALINYRKAKIATKCTIIREKQESDEQNEMETRTWTDDGEQNKLNLNNK